MRFSPHLRAVLQALFVTFLWSTSWVLIKVALNEIPPLTFAGLRYTLAFLILLPGLWKHRVEVRALSASQWRRLAALGLVFYTMTQGGQFLTLYHLEAVTFSLVLSFTPVLVALFGVIALREVPSRRQWGGIVIFVAGVLIYFRPVSMPDEKALGLALAGFTVCGLHRVLRAPPLRSRERTIPPLVVTVISMGVGAVSLR